MDLDRFKASISARQPPKDVSLLLQALWWDAKGEWGKAHDIAQDEGNPAGAWVHAYLHRVEGDIGNAGYWYRLAGKPAATGSLKAEWDSIVAALL